MLRAFEIIQVIRKGEHDVLLQGRGPGVRDLVEGGGFAYRGVLVQQIGDCQAELAVLLFKELLCDAGCQQGYALVVSGGMIVSNGIGQGSRDQPAAIGIGGDLGIEYLGEGIEVGGGGERILVDGIGRSGAEVHVEILLDIGGPVDLFGEGGGPGIIVLITHGRQFGIDEVLAL